MAKDVNFSFPEGSSGLVSSFLDGGNPLRYWILQIFNGNVIALVLIPIVGIVLFWIYKITYKQTHLTEDSSVPEGVVEWIKSFPLQLISERRIQKYRF